jgi:hypothetical protein
VPFKIATVRRYDELAERSTYFEAAERFLREQLTVGLCTLESS